MKWEIDDRVEEKIDGTETPAEDGPDLQGVARLQPMAGIIAQLEIHAVPEGPFRGVRRNKQHAHLGTVDQRPLITGDCV